MTVAFSRRKLSHGFPKHEVEGDDDKSKMIQMVHLCWFLVDAGNDCVCLENFRSFLYPFFENHKSNMCVGCVA